MGAGGSFERSKVCEDDDSQPPSPTETPQSPRKSFVANFGDVINLTGSNGRKNSKRKVNEICRHEYVERWEDGYRCIDCKEMIVEIERIAKEDAWQSRIKEEDEKIGGESEQANAAINRGVTIKWLLEFTKQNDCWLLPTWLVRRNIILPATSSSRCRYVDLPHMKESNTIGKATTYISHCWGAPWGSLITALCSGGTVNLDRYVWCDLFAVRQWNGNIADLNYRNVIRLCSSFLFCCSSRPSHRLNSADPLAGDVSNIISLYRTWCLVELYTAISCNIAVIIRCGSYQRPSLLSPQHTFKNNSDLLERLSTLIDINQSYCTRPNDRIELFKDMEDCPGGIEGVRSVVKGVVKGAVLCCTFGDENIYNAASGDVDALEILKKNLGQSLVIAAAGGYLTLVQQFIEGGAPIESRYQEYTPLMAAAAGGHLETVKYLLSRGACVAATHITTGNTPLLYAAAHGFHETANQLLLKGAPIDLPNSQQQTPLILAAENGHTHTVTFLLSRGAQINHHDSRGCTSLYLAASNGHTTTVKVLLSKGAMKLTKNLEGYNAITIAEKRNYPDCVALLTDQNDPRRPR